MLTYRCGPQSDPFYYIFSSDQWLRDYDPPGPFPLFVNLELTNTCQLNCLFCTRQLATRPLGYLDLGLAEVIFAEMAQYSGAAVRLTGWGEPLLHPQIGPLVEMIKRYGLKLKIYTNGLALTEELMDLFIELEVDDLQFSMQGLTPEQYEFNRVLANFQDFSRQVQMAAARRVDRPRPFLSLLTSVLADELAEADPAEFTRNWLKLVDKVAVDLTNLNFVSSSLRVQPYLDRQSAGLTRGPCVDVFLALEVKFDGSIQFCGQDAQGRPDHTIGNVRQMTLAEAWLGPAMEYKRQSVGRELGHQNFWVCRDCYHNTSKYELFKNLDNPVVMESMDSSGSKKNLVNLEEIW